MGRSWEGVKWGDVLDGDFVLRGPKQFLKSDLIVMCTKLLYSTDICPPYRKDFVVLDEVSKVDLPASGEVADLDDGDCAYVSHPVKNILVKQPVCDSSDSDGQFDPTKGLWMSKPISVRDLLHCWDLKN